MNDDPKPAGIGGRGMTGARRIQAGGVLLASAFVIGLYGPAVHSTYRLDDFAWLSLGNNLHGARDLLWALFSPQAQGTIRPLGDRLWFLLASSWFGLNPVPFHVFALCVQIGNVLLVADTGRLLLSCRLAAAFAVVLWVVNDTLVLPVMWASAFNEVFYTFCFLVSFNAFLRWLAAGRRLWLIVHLLTLVLALGALELAVTLPAVAAAYVFLFARHQWKKLLPSVSLAAIYVLVHFLVVRLPRDGPYQLRFGRELIVSFWRYWAAALGPEEYARAYGRSVLIGRLETGLLTAAVLLWLGIRARRGHRLPLFCLLWFVIPLAPTLPLLNHFTPYYTFLPSIGLAWLAGDAVASVSSWRNAVAALLCAAVYAGSHVPSAFAARNYNRDQSASVARREARLLEAVRQIRQVQPRGPVFLSGLDMEQFWWGLCYGRLARDGFTGLHVFPERVVPEINPPARWCFTPDFLLSSAETNRLLREEHGRIYDITQSPPKALPVPADR